MFRNLIQVMIRHNLQTYQPIHSNSIKLILYEVILRYEMNELLKKTDYCRSSDVVNVQKQHVFM